MFGIVLMQGSADWYLTKDDDDSVVLLAICWFFTPANLPKCFTF